MKRITLIPALYLLLVHCPGHAATGLNIALTNDDGWSTYGIHALYNALTEAGHTVTLAAPAAGESGSSAAINTTPLLITKQAENIYSVASATGSAEPATAGAIAIHIASRRDGNPPDLLVSGINDGANLGPGAQVSGTVGAAIVAIGRMIGDSVPAIAISTDERCRFREPASPQDAVVPDPGDIPAPCKEVARFVVEVVDRLAGMAGSNGSESKLLPPGLGLNINYPPEQPTGVRAARQGHLMYVAPLGGYVSMAIGCEEDCLGMPVGASTASKRFGGRIIDAPDVENSDSALYAAGYITIVPIEADYTASSSGSGALVEKLSDAISAPHVPAQSDPERLRPAWLALDANRDGTVALAEVHPLQARVMKRHDLDEDGAVSLSEYVSYDLDPGGAARVPIPDTVRLIEDLSYAGTDDPRQRLDVYLPKQPAVSGPLPVVAFVHGGGWSMGSKISARSQMPALVNTGRFAAVSIGYRLSWQAPWSAQMHDVKAGIRWIRANAGKYGLDPARICAFGPSAGGHLAAMLGTTNGEKSLDGGLGEYTAESSDVQCAVDLFGHADLRAAEALDARGNPSMVTRLLGGPAAENARLAENASPVQHVDPGDVPFYIVHGNADPIVDYSESVELSTALREAGVPVFFQTVDGGGHGDFGVARPEVERRVRAFLEKMFYNPSLQVPVDVLEAAE